MSSPGGKRLSQSAKEPKKSWFKAPLSKSMKNLRDLRGRRASAGSRMVSAPSLVRSPLQSLSPPLSRTHAETSATCVEEAIQGGRRAVRRLLDTERMFQARLDVLREDYLQTLRERNGDWPPRIARDRLYDAVSSVATFDDGFLAELERCAATFPDASFARVFEINIDRMQVYIDYAATWLEVEPLTAQEHMTNAALSLQNVRLVLSLYHSFVCFQFVLFQKFSVADALCKRKSKNVT